MVKLMRYAIPVLVVFAVISLVSWTVQSPFKTSAAQVAEQPADDLGRLIDKINQHFREQWQQQNLEPAALADDLTVLRRLTLSLFGTVPSLEEIRAFEADTGTDRLAHWTNRMLEDNRMHHYLAERLARTYVGTELQPFLIYRRDQFIDWLASQLKKNTPYDELVQQIISEQGYWTGTPATNFITATIVEGNAIDESELTTRTARAFLGTHLDCAQCHDDFFTPWKQSDFHSLAAFYGQSSVSAAGVGDNPDKQYKWDDGRSQKKQIVSPLVPYQPDLLPNSGTHRQRLAGWVTHPKNRRFSRAIVNRVWALLFGKPYVEPVDQLPDPAETSEDDLLNILADDLVQHNFNLRRLVRIITGLQVFRQSSAISAMPEPKTEQMIDHWAVFPLIRLRSEQIVGAMLQASSIKTVDQNTHFLIRFQKYFQQNDFVQEYGDMGTNELESKPGTIPQALMRMNGNLPNEMLKTNAINAAGRISGLSESNETCLEACYLVCLTRRPTKMEQKYFLQQLEGANQNQRARMIEDIFWSLFNSPEFAWNH